jgi:AFG3 family protein
VRSLVENAYEEAQRIIRDHVSELRQITEMLLEKEVIFGSDLENILGKRPEQKRQDEEAENEKKAEEKVKKAEEEKGSATVGGNGQESPGAEDPGKEDGDDGESVEEDPKKKGGEGSTD